MGKQSKGKLRILPGMTPEETKLAVQAAFLLGFQAESAQFPVCGEDGEIPVPADEEELKALFRLQPKTLEEAPEGYLSATKSAKPTPQLDWRQRKGLETIFQTGEFLKDDNLDQLPDRLNFYMVLPEKSSVSLVIAACTLAFRFGMETTGAEGWLLHEHYDGGNAVLFEDADRCAIREEDTDHGILIHVEGNGKELEQFFNRFCRHFPYVNSFENWKYRMQRMTDDLALRNLDGQLAALAAEQKQRDNGKYRAFVSPEIEACRDRVQSRFPNTEFINYKGMVPVWTKEYDIPWEVDVCREVFEKEVLPNLSQGDTVEIAAALSEESDVREELAKELVHMAESRGVSSARADIICAYKQGYSWIDECILPQMKGQKPTKLVIRFRPFLPEGVTDWGDDVDGSQPSHAGAAAKGEDYWFDMPIRFLQELYPVDDRIAEVLGIDRDDVVFQAYEGDEDITYECAEILPDGSEKRIGTYRAAVSERYYLDEYPELGKVHPDTGYLRVRVNGKPVLDRRIATDLENVWEIYQKEVLPESRIYAEKKLGRTPTLDDQPFFSRLQIDLALSEPDHKLSSRQDLFSSLDGFQEDMYFTGEDYYKYYGMKVCGERFDEPGLILPKIIQGRGKPRFTVSLMGKAAPAPQILEGDMVIANVVPRDRISCRVMEVFPDKDGLGIGVEITGVQPERVREYAALSESGFLETFRGLNGIGRVALHVGDETYTAQAHPEEKGSPLDIRSMDLSEGKLIGYEDCMKILSQLKRVPGLAVYRQAVSYTGRELWAVEILPHESGYISRTKRITNHPSEFINCRHHANEVSSTNAAFLLIREILTNPKYQDLPDRINLVIVPMENVDGAAIHYELQKDNPEWKFHTARYNAIGKEFYYEHFVTDTRNTEAFGLQRLFETFLPDFLIDDHGIPTHEWDQQFSGYVSPAFRGFWLPRSMVYGCMWLITDPEYHSNYDVNLAIQDAVADAIRQDPERLRWNRECRHAFEKYAHSWMPNMFASEYYKDMINYHVKFRSDPNHRYPSVRFPWIVTAAYTSEVIDETATGDFLAFIADVHKVDDLAILELLESSESCYETALSASKDDFSVRCVRHRPVVIPKQ